MKRTILITVLLLALSVCSFSQTAEQVISLLYDIEKLRTVFDNEIIYMEEFNFGIPGGANWLVEWRDRRMVEGNIRVSIIPMIYVVDINIGEIKFRNGLPLRSESDVSYFRAYYESFPGVTRGDRTYQIGDFNGDGFDEIAQFMDGASSPTFEICGYDSREGNMKWNCSIPYDKRYYPSPVEFIIYKGMKGFKLRYYVNEVAGGPGWVPEPSPKNGRWFFYTWDEEQRIFVEIEEVKEGGIESPWPILAVQDTGKRIWTPANNLATSVAEEPPEEEPYFAMEDGNKNSRFGIRIVLIIGGAVVVAGGVALFIVKRKK